MAETVRVRGLRQLDRRLATLPTKVGFKALRSGMMKASLPMFKLAKSNAQSVGIKALDAGSTAAAMGRWTRKLSPTRTALFMGPRNKNKKALALWNTFHGKDAKRLNHFHLVEFGSVNGPAQPFLRPAFEAAKLQYVQSIRREIDRAIDKAVGLA